MSDSNPSPRLELATENRITVPKGSLVAYTEWVNKLSSPATPIRERLEMTWEKLRHELDTSREYYNPNMSRLHARRTIHSLALLLVEAGLSQRVESLPDADIGARRRGIELLQRAVYVTQRYPHQINADELVEERFAAFMEHHSAQLTLLHDLRTELMNDPIPPGNSATSKAEPQRPLQGSAKYTVFDLLAVVRELRSAIESPIPYEGRPRKTRANFPEERYEPIRQIFWDAIRNWPDSLPLGVEMKLRDVLTSLMNIQVGEIEDPNDSHRRWLNELREIEKALCGTIAPEPAGAPGPPVMKGPPTNQTGNSEVATPDKKSPRPKRDPNQPSKDKQNDILVTIRNAKMPLTRDELSLAMKRKREGKLGHWLGWMTKNNILVSIPHRGYWPAGEPVPE